MASTTGIIGIGNMGLAMAFRLRDLGHSVRVRDLDPAREAAAAAQGAQVAATPAALAAGCDCVIVAVVDAEQAEDVLFGVAGAAAAMAAGACVMLCPTIAPTATEGIAARLARRGIETIDAPMSGGPVRARDGRMSLMVACDPAVFERHRRLLDMLSDQVFRVGEQVGDGARTKLVNNLLAAVNLAGAAEALALAQKVGLDPARTQAVIEASSGQSWIGTDRMRRALADDLAPRAHTTLLRKDAHLAVALAEAAGFAPRLGRAAANLFALACAAGHGALDDGSLLSFVADEERRTWLAEAGVAHDSLVAQGPAAAPRMVGAPGRAAATCRGSAPGRAVAPRSATALGSAAPSGVVADGRSAPSGGVANGSAAVPALSRGIGLGGDPLIALDAATVARFADCALQSLGQLYPCALHHLMAHADDRPQPRVLHPLFHGSYDWHSSVHMHWSLVRLLRRTPHLPQRAAVLAHFEHRFTAAAVECERAYLHAHPAFQRTYGWAWLLQLHRELHAAASGSIGPDAARWAAQLEPLVGLVRARWLAHLSATPFPQRAGVHVNSAFAMLLALDHARDRGDTAFAASITAAALRWFGDDTRYPLAYEPGAADFLPGGLCEAVLMAEVLGGAEYATWWRAFLPDEASLAPHLDPVAVVSRTDPQWVHADGLNLSRAWCFGRLARHLPHAAARLHRARDEHLLAAWPHVTGGDFVATHWLVSFALLAASDLSLSAAPGRD